MINDFRCVDILCIFVLNTLTELFINHLFFPFLINYINEIKRNECN